MAHKNEKNWSPHSARNAGKKSSGRGRHKKPVKIYPFEEANDRVEDIFRNHGYEGFPHETRRELVRFYLLLSEQQQKENFTRLTELKDIAIKHFLDCIMIPDLLDLQFPLLDLGTGPGFPGIPLKILYPDKMILLAEGVQKRVEFLKKVRDEMELKNIRIIGRNVDPEFEYPVQTVITRAVEDIGNTIENTKGCLETGGRLVFMKGPNCDPEIKEAKKRHSKTHTHIETLDYTIPNTPHKRRLVVFERLAR